MFKITSESGIAAGVRRIEAVCASKAEHYINEKLEELSAIYTQLKNSKDAIHSITQLQEENNALKKQIEQQALVQVAHLKTNLKNKIKSINNINVLITNIDNISAEALKKLQFDLKNEVDNLFFLATTVNNDKPLLSLIIADNVVTEKNLHAGSIIKQLAKNIKGGGGGQAFYATAGGNDASGIDAAIQEAEEIIK
ncbi:MAG: DHHA1 domain-containing protein [Chitinophagales bacterium]